MYSIAYHLLCEIRHFLFQLDILLTIYLTSRTSSVCTGLNQDVGTHICVCLKHRLLVMIWLVKPYEIGCWDSGQPRPLIANHLMPSEKQTTKVTIKQLGRVVKLKQCPSVLLAWSQPGILLHNLFGQTSKGPLVTSCHDQEKECCRTLCKRLKTEIK